METVPVESSNIARIGYADGMLRVEFQGGAIYDYRATAEEYAALMASPSKGRWVKENLGFRRAVRQEATTAKTPDIISPESRTLHFFEQDDCCAPRLTTAAEAGRLDRAESWTCPKCGCEYKASMVDGVKRWHSDEAVELFGL